MRERPIIFSSEMIRAILKEKKTQTRRPIKPQPHPEAFSINHHRHIEKGDYVTWINPFGEAICPYGKPGDRLWVKETWRIISLDGLLQARKVEYKADRKMKEFYHDSMFNIHESGDWPPSAWGYGDSFKDIRWCSPFFMPRWASRITLEIINIRIERLQEIDPMDALHEGCHIDWSIENCPEKQFQRVWDSIYAKKGFGWDKNPWVWVIEFRRCI